MEQRSFGRILRKALSQPVSGEQERQRLRRLGYEGTWMDLLSQAQVERAARGDTAAFRLLRDTMAQEEEHIEGSEDLRCLSDQALRKMLAQLEEAS